MNRIAIDARELSTSSGRYVERLLHYLQEIDHENTYKVLLKQEDFDAWHSSNQNFEKVVCRYKEFTFGEQLGLAVQLQKLRADLIHFPMAQQPILYRGKTITTMNDLTTARFRNLAKNPVIFMFKQRVYRWLNRSVAKKSEFIVTFSQFVKDDIVSFTRVNADKIVVTRLAAEKIKANPEVLASVNSRQFLLYVGRPMSHKNLERLIEAFHALQESQPDLKLVLAGKMDNNYRRIERSVQKQGINNVIFAGFVSEGQLRWLYENCRAYVFPSLSEGFGLPGLEAMMHGAPVLSSNATCLPEIYGAAAHYFDPLNVQAMTDAIKEVLTNADLREELIEKGYAQAAKYSWQKTAEQTLEVYNRVLG